MHQIHYEQVGSLAWCEQYRDSMDTLMERALNGDNDAEPLVVNCAAHFYGLVIWDFDGSIKDLCQAVRDIDHEQKAR